MHSRLNFGIPLNQQHWFAYMEHGKLLMGIKHHYMTKNARMRFFYFLRKNDKGGWKLKLTRGRNAEFQTNRG